MNRYADSLVAQARSTLRHSIAISLCCMFSGVQAADLPAKDLIDLSLEQLSSIVVTSVSREDERLSAAAASYFVISGKDNLRSGARTRPEALRRAPKLLVAQVDA